MSFVMRAGKIALRLMIEMIGAVVDRLPLSHRLAALDLINRRFTMEMSLEIGDGKRLRLSVPDAGSVSRNQRILTKEPETIRWLDGMDANDVLWDVGANIGSYALYAAMRRGVRAVAFEPMAESYIALVRNVRLNSLEDLVTPCALALTDHAGPGVLNLTSAYSGSSGHSFSLESPAIETTMRQPVLGSDASALVDRLAVPDPTHMKIDVDGIEYQILRGAERLLSHPKLKSILVEVNSDDAQIDALLKSYGFEIKDMNRDNHIYVRN